MAKEYKKEDGKYIIEETNTFSREVNIVEMERERDRFQDEADRIDAEIKELKKVK